MKNLLAEIAEVCPNTMTKFRDWLWENRRDQYSANPEQVHTELQVGVCLAFFADCELNVSTFREIYDYTDGHLASMDDLCLGIKKAFEMLERHAVEQEKV